MKNSIAMLGYVTGVGFAAIAASVLLPGTGLGTQLPQLLILILLAATVGSRSVKITRRRIALTAGDAFVFYALIAIGPLAAPLVALASTVGAVYGGKKRPSGICAAFNFGSTSLAAALAAWMFVMLASLQPEGLGFMVLPLMAATACFVFVNLVLVGMAIALSGGSFLDPWKASGICAVSSAACSMLVGTALAIIVEATGPAGLLLGLTGSMVLLESYRALARRMDAELGIVA